MQNKFTTTDEIPQHLVAGIELKNQNDIELFGIVKNQSVQFLQAGKVHYFKDLKPRYFAQLYNKFYKDLTAVQYFKQFDISIKRKVEIYTYYCYGTLDHKPDFVNGILQPSENFRESTNCPSLQFSGKDITIDGVILTLREIIIIDMSARECTDFEIALELGITESTLGFHKKQLFIKTNTQTKLGVVMKAFSENIIS